MGTDAIYNVDATALFYARPQPDMGNLLTDLNARLAGQEGCHLQMSPLSHADWWLLACEKFHIMISFSDAPTPDSALAEASMSPVTGLRRFDYVQVVQGHKAHLRVEIGDGHAPLPPEARLIMQEFGSSATCEPTLKMMALHWTSQFIARHQGFLALYFGPSERLFCPEELKETENHDMPVGLLMHPTPSLPEPGPNGVDGYALRLRNPRHLEGPALELEGIPVSVPLKAAVGLLTTLFRARAKGKVTLTHGKVLKPSEKISLFVREGLPDDEAPEGRVILSFWDDRGHDAPKPEAAAAVADAAPAPGAEADVATEDETPQPKRLRLRRKKTEDSVEASAPEPETASDTLDGTLVATETAIPRLDRLTDDTQSETPDETGGEDIAGAAPRRKGLGAWLSARLGRSPREARLKVASIALILALARGWNPYEDFTGGIAVGADQYAQASAVQTPRFAPEQLIALLTD